jgi:hypothetical protein
MVNSAHWGVKCVNLGSSVSWSIKSVTRLKLVTGSNPNYKAVTIYQYLRYNLNIIMLWCLWA